MTAPAADRMAPEAASRLRPAPAQQVLLTAGTHTLTINATTNDALYHFEAFYQFGLSFQAV